MSPSTSAPVATHPARERGAHGGRERGAGPLRERDAAAVLDALEQSIDRKRIGERGNGAGVRRRERETRPACAVPCRRERADRTRRVDPGQRVRAGVTQQGAGGASDAELAALREQQTQDGRSARDAAGGGAVK